MIFVKKAKIVVSSGGVVYRKIRKSFEIAIIAWKKSEGDKERLIWALPKGIVEENESLKEAALREVNEETGITAEIVEKLGSIDYWFYSREDNLRYHKFVHFFLMRYSKGNLDSHDFEVLKVKWFPIDEAIDNLSYPSEAEIVKKAKEMLFKK